MYVCLLGGKKCLFFVKFGVLYFLETPVLRFALLPYYRRCQCGKYYAEIREIDCLCCKRLQHATGTYTAQKMKFCIKDFFSKCDQIRSFLRIWSHLLKKSLTGNFTFCVVVIFEDLLFNVVFYKLKSQRYKN